MSFSGTVGDGDDSEMADYVVDDMQRKSAENQTRTDTMEKAYRKQKTMPLSSQSEDKEVQSSKRQGYYDETESALSPPIDSQVSHPEVNETKPLSDVKKGF